MSKNKFKRNYLTIMVLIGTICSSYRANEATIKLIKVCEGLTSPVAMTTANDGSGRLFICEQNGCIRIVKNGVLQAEPFLSVQDKLIPQTNDYSERGLLGLAFHPQYKTNRKFYVYYSASSPIPGSNHKSVIAEYKTLSTDANKADKNSERIILEITQPESNHNGGELVFGLDGFLYIGSGDGGGAGDKHGNSGNGQNTENLLGKILRIDVNTDKGYLIPGDNPFVNKPGRDEIWAFGLRNPWKFSFDDNTGRLFCADVGQDAYEEIDIVTKGGNYGWRVMEGKHCYNPEVNCRQAGLILPIAEYPHSEGICIIGGYVYRGVNKLHQGQYFFADWTGKLFVLKPSKSGSQTMWSRESVSLPVLPNQTYFNSMGRDENGNLYLLAMQGMGPNKSTGILYRIDW
jgi:glucose/arabinose dehydrogenase